MESSYGLEPKKMFKYVVAFFVPAGMKVLPTLTMEIAVSAILGWIAGLQTITVSLIGVYLLAGISTIVTHGFFDGTAKKALLQGVHMWLVLGALAMSGSANIFPVDPYPFTALVFVVYELLLILKNFSAHSGINTPWLDKPLEIFLSKPPVSLENPNDTLEKAHQQYEHRNDTPTKVIVQIKDAPKP